MAPAIGRGSTVSGNRVTAASALGWHPSMRGCDLTVCRTLN